MRYIHIHTTSRNYTYNSKRARQEATPPSAHTVIPVKSKPSHTVVIHPLYLPLISYHYTNRIRRTRQPDEEPVPVRMCQDIKKPE